ncbi:MULTISPECIES: ricin-type beta-trefoil lectin domain protein [unclassified Streptomyces]|uniref:ricin-type beta-trefoil lectin domain protein n=1 Tax=unclassified Streptomyces TaxID=2593676 RepID=UPI0035DD6686
MTRSAQQPSASARARAESASESEETAAAPLGEPTPEARPGTSGATPEAKAATSDPEPEATPAPAKAGAGPAAPAGTAEVEPEPGEPTGEAGKRAGADGTAADPGAGAAAGPDASSGATSGPGTSSGARPDADPDSGATAAAESRLPALVRTMTATAIGRPQQSGPVGRPGKAVLAGAAIAGALLVSVPFLVLATDDDKDPDRPATAAGTVLTGSEQEAPGEFAVTPTEPGTPGDGTKGKGPEASEKPARPVEQAPEDPTADPGKAAGAEKKDDAEKPAAPKKQSSGGQKSGSTRNKPAAAPAVTLSAPVSFRSHLSGRCIDVPGHDFSDGKALHMWDCNNAAAQKWQFASDGTIRIQGLCLDVANANFSDGTVIQIARCSDNPAQKFALNGAHDLVNTVVGMCVDIAGANPDNRAALQLLKCSGNPAQKWST